MKIPKENMRSKFEELVTFAHERKVSDIFVNTDLSVAMKIDGELNYLQNFVFDEDDVYNLIEEITRPEAYQEFLKTHELNLMVEVHNVTYLRVNCYIQRGVPGLVLRLIPMTVPHLEELNLPYEEHLRKLSMARRGLILMIGATGNGKSTTLAGMVNHRNENSRHHIITVEDPIEFMHTSKKCVVIQREVGIDTHSYGAALKNSLREAPDVILIGEIRDEETMHYALQFAETGHLCMATIHATNCVQGLERVYNMFPKDQREKLQMDLANNLRGMIAQRLMPKQGGGRTVALEMMTGTAYVRQLVMEGRLDKIAEVVDRGNPEQGIISFDACIFDLYEREIVSYEEACNYVASVNDFRVRIRSFSKRRLPAAMQTDNNKYSVLSEEAREREILRKEREEARKKKAQNSNE